MQPLGAERPGHRLAEQLRTAHDPALLGAVPGVEVALERPRGGLVARCRDVIEHVEQRELARFGAEDRPGGGGEQPAEPLGDRVLLDELGERLAVVRRCVRGGPGSVDRDGGRHLIEQGDRRDHLGQDQGVRRGAAERPGVAELLPVAVVDVDVVALVVVLERADTEAIEGRQHPILGRADERAAPLGYVTTLQLVAGDPAADAIARLDDRDREAGALDLEGGTQPGEARTDDDHVGLDPSAPPSSTAGGPRPRPGR